MSLCHTEKGKTWIGILFFSSFVCLFSSLWKDLFGKSNLEYEAILVWFANFMNGSQPYLSQKVVWVEFQKAFYLNMLCFVIGCGDVDK